MAAASATAAARANYAESDSMAAINARKQHTHTHREKTTRSAMSVADGAAVAVVDYAGLARAAVARIDARAQEARSARVAAERTENARREAEPKRMALRTLEIYDRQHALRLTYPRLALLVDIQYSKTVMATFGLILASFLVFILFTAMACCEHGRDGPRPCNKSCDENLFLSWLALASLLLISVPVQILMGVFFYYFVVTDEQYTEAKDLLIF